MQNIKTGDYLSCVLFESRLSRIQKALSGFTKNKSLLERVICGVPLEIATPSQSLGADQSTIIYPAVTFCELIKEIKEDVIVFEKELPKSALKGFDDCNFENTLKLATEILSFSNLEMNAWLVDVKSPSMFGEKVATFSRNIHEYCFRNVDNIKLDILREASLVFSTVNIAGRNIFKFVDFDVALVDEATQVHEAEIAIVLRRSLKCLVLAGDNMQLPPTVLSDSCNRFGFGQSTFNRLLEQGYPYTLLNIQYRMHPLISRWPRGQFYDGRLTDGYNVLSDDYSKVWHKHVPPLMVLNLSESAESSTLAGSKYNELESRLVRQVLLHLKRCVETSVTVGIISPHKEQVERLRDLEVSSLNSRADGRRPAVRVATIDSFQGQECDVVIFSAVRANKNKNVGFLKDFRRLNVAITRAKYALVVICNVDTVIAVPAWRSLIEYSSEMGMLFNSKGNEIVSRVVKKHKDELKKLKSALDVNSSLFSNAIWNVDFATEFKNEMKAFGESVRSKVISVAISLAEGVRPKHQAAFRIADTFENIMQVIRVPETDLYIIWSTDVTRGDVCTQNVVIWDVKLRNYMSSAIKRTEARLKSYSNEYLARCKLRKRAEERLVPCTWRGDPNFVWYRKPDTKSDHEKYCTELLEAGQVANITKFHPLSDAVVRLFLSPHIRKDLELPFKMSSDEDFIVRHPGSVLVLGRSGTGNPFDSYLQWLFNYNSL